MSHTTLSVYADASVQPQATGLGVAIKDEQGQLIAWRNKAAQAMTCNEAAYAALIFALEQVLGYAPREVRVYLGSRLVIEQMRGWIRVRSTQLRRLHHQARDLAGRFERVSFTHIPRDRNQLADAIADEAVNGSAADKRIGSG
ncbi:MAG TPA: ribonuclease HI family protein [Anaerolineae bacterium]